VRPAHLLAVLVSALLGAGLGVAGGLVTGSSHRVQDPLALGIPLVNQDCTNKSVIVIATGSTSSGLAAAVAAAKPGSARYLETAHSCRTSWVRPGRDPRRYVAYLGPYSDVANACRERMTVEHQEDQVAILSSGSTEPVQCLCHLSYNSSPVLRSGETGVLESMYVWGLQDLLTHLDRNPETHINGRYDTQTIEEVKQFQQDHALPANGVVNPATWQRLVSRACNRYPY
jgi:peptidoglycan hydrolase-like protein with peptidoglycan-binding domain